MNGYSLNLLLGILCLQSAVAQNADSSQEIYGLRQTWGIDQLSHSDYPGIHGAVQNYKWEDIEPSNNVWKWQALDSEIMNTEIDLPIMLMIFTKEESPDWLYTRAGVPKVIEYSSKNDSVGFSPYYPDPGYKFYFERMIDSVANHIKAFPDNVRKRLSIQGCLGEEDDYIGYRGVEGSDKNDTLSMHVDSIYQLNRDQLAALYKEYTRYYYDRYAGSNIGFGSNPSCVNSESGANIQWVIDSLPGSFIKNIYLGKGYQQNDELDKLSWLMPALNSNHKGVYLRGRSDFDIYASQTGYWLSHPERNTFALFTYMIHWGMDWSDQMPTTIREPLYTPAFDFLNKYAGEKDTLTAAHAMCALRDGLDAADSIRFPSRTYGTVSRKNAKRYFNIQKNYSSKGALLNDVAHAMMSDNQTSAATGINDVGWKTLPGNYERYLHQINPNATSVGYWNVDAPNDTSSIYGRFARGFDLAHAKNVLYFNVDNGFLHKAPLNGKYPVMISVTYLDKGFGSWQLIYDAQGNANKPSIYVTCKDSGRWKRVSVTLRDAYFGNRGVTGCDFRIKSTNNENVIFALVELERPDAAVSNDGLFASALPAFDTLCIKSTSDAKSFMLTGAFLNSSNVIVGPLPGFEFSAFADGAYHDSLIISNHGTVFSKPVYVKFVPTIADSYNRSIPVRGGGVAPIYVAVKAVAVNSSPQLSAKITPVSCMNANDGSINLITTGGTPPFTYSWTGAGAHKSTTQDLSGLPPSTYTVSVSSYPGCMVRAKYVVTEPDALTISFPYDSILCRGGTTTVHVSAAGGTPPYKGTGNFTVSGGRSVFTVTDAHGCSASQPVMVSNGTGVKPDKPVSILGEAADATGLCGGGDFNYWIAPVKNATSYTWIPPAGCIVKFISGDRTHITLRVPANFIKGTLSVTADNFCGSSRAQTKTLTAVPARPGTISGPVHVVALQKGLVYKVPQVAGLSYDWRVPSGAKIVSGSHTATIKVNWGKVSGSVTAKAVNTCGSSFNSILSVKVTNQPGSPQNLEKDSMSGGIVVLPNPAENIAHLLFTASAANNYTVILTDVNGKVLMQKNGIAVKGENTVNLDVHNYADGMYIVTWVDYTGEIKRTKLLKQ